MFYSFDRIYLSICFFYLGIASLFRSFLSQATGGIALECEILLALSFLLIAIISLVKLRFSKKRSLAYSNPIMAICMVYFFLLMLTGIYMYRGFSLDAEYSKVSTLINFLLLCHLLPAFIEDVKANKTSCKLPIINFLPFLFLLPNYLGVWANDKTIIKVISICVIYLITFRLNIRTLLKIACCLGLSLLVLLLPTINILIPICILVSIFFILQFSDENKNYFVLAILFGIAMIRILIFTFPVVFNLFSIFSEFYSKASSMHIGGGSGLGLSLSGYELFIILFTIVVFFVLMTKNIRYAYPILFFSFVYSIYLQVFPFLLGHFPTVALNFRFILLLVFCSCLLLSELGRDKDCKINIEKKYLNSVHSRVLLGVVAVLLVIGFTKFLFIKDDNKNKSIAIVSVSKDVADLTPISNTDNVGYGYTPYIYGSVEMYLKLFGYNTEIFYELAAVPLDNFDAIILIHYNIASDYTTKKKIENFVFKGGSVFAVSDHTNIFNSMNETNKLLSFSALRIEDDICDSLMHYSGKVWENSLGFLNAFSTHGINNEHDIGVWGGASVSSNNLLAEPIVIAKYGLSDPADNSEMGVKNSFMGNRKFDIGERAGNIPLVYNTRYGEGNVVLFGDASYFQVPIMMYNWNFIAKLFFEVLYTKKSYIFSIIQLVIILLVFVLLVLINAKYEAKNINKLFILILCFSILLSHFITTFQFKKLENVMLKNFSSNYIAIDQAHENFYSVNMLANNEISGLGYNSMKLQMPIICTTNGDILNNGRGIIIMNPRTQISRTEVSKLHEYLTNGNSILVILGKDNEMYCKLLFDNYKISIGNEFLGPLPWKFLGDMETQNITGPEFKEAWNIIYNQNTVPYYSYNDMVPVTKTSVGKGSLYLIADSRFISPENLEGEMTGNENNIRFIQNILKEMVK